MPRVVAAGGDSELAVVVVPGCDLDQAGWLAYEVAGFSAWELLCSNHSSRLYSCKSQ